MQTDLEESKDNEIAKLQQSLQEMQERIDETNNSLIKERETAQKAVIEAAAAASVVKETPVTVEDTEKIETLTAEINNLKVDFATSLGY